MFGGLGKTHYLCIRIATALYFMTQEQKNQGALDLANMLRLIIQDEEQSETEEVVCKKTNSDEEGEDDSDLSDTSSSMEDIGEMMGKVMLVPGMNFTEIMNDPKFKKVLSQTIKGATEMLSGATKVIKDLPEDGLTVESGLAAVAEVMTKNSTRTSFHDFTEYIIHEDKQMAMSIMKKMYDGLSGLKVVWLTSFFIEIGWLIEPSSISILDTFNVKKFTKQLYSKHKYVAIPVADRKAFAACLENYITSYKEHKEQ